MIAACRSDIVQSIHMKSSRSSTSALANFSALARASRCTASVIVSEPAQALEPAPTTPTTIRDGFASTAFPPSLLPVRPGQSKRS